LNRCLLLLLVAAAFVWVVGTATAQLADSAWPCSHQNLQRTGRSPSSRMDTPELLWTFDAPSRVLGTPIFGLDGKVYFACSMYLYSLSSEGNLEWPLELFADADAGLTQGHDGTLYVAASNNQAYFLTDGGEIVWNQNISACSAFNPTLAEDGCVYFGTRDYLMAMGPDQMLRWHFSGQLDIYTDFEAAPAVAADGTIYCPCKRVAWQTALIALSPDGEELYDAYYTADVDLITPAIGPEGTVYFPTGSYLVALNPDLTVKWRFLVSGQIKSTPLITAHGDIVVATTGNSFYCIDKSGLSEKSWFYPIDGEIHVSPVADAEGRMYLATSGGEIYSFTPDGDLLWRYNIGIPISSEMVIGPNGELLVGHADGTLLCIGSRDSGNQAPEITSGSVWPATGAPGDDFTYTIKYYDPDGDAPYRVSVWIDHDAFEMTLSSGKPSNGTYEYTTTLCKADHTYYFSAVDTRGKWVRYPVGEDHFAGPAVEDEIEVAPRIYLTLEKETFKAGDEMNVYAYAENLANEPVFVDAYVALCWYDGQTFLFLPDFSIDARPFISRVLLPANNRTEMFTVFSQLLPTLVEANYAWIGVLTPVDSPDDVLWFARKYWRFTD